MTVARLLGMDCSTFLAINFSQLLINAVTGKVESSQNYISGHPD